MKVLNIGIKVILAAYLIRVLGNEKYGLLTWLDSVIQYFIMIINFGFNIYAAKYIVENRKKTDNINEIVSSIFIIKAFLFVISIICIIALGQFEIFNVYKNILILFMFCCLG
jgi:PST family polysaccharide transporter